MPTTTASRCTRLTRPPTAKPVECFSGEAALWPSPYLPALREPGAVSALCPPGPAPPPHRPALCWAQRGWGGSLQCLTIRALGCLDPARKGGGCPRGAPVLLCTAAWQGQQRSRRGAGTGPPGGRGSRDQGFEGRAIRGADGEVGLVVFGPRPWLRVVLLSSPHPPVGAPSTRATCAPGVGSGHTRSVWK